MGSVSRLLLASSVLSASVSCAKSGDTGLDTQSPDPTMVPLHACFDSEVQALYPLSEPAQISLAIHKVVDTQNNVHISENGIQADLALTNAAFEGVAQFSISGYNDVGVDVFLRVDGESDEEYDSRTWAFMAANDVQGSIDIFYVYQNLGISGSGISTRVANDGSEGYVVVYVGDDGVTENYIALPHELGHYFELRHPFDSRGDGLDDTVDYGEACADIEAISAPYPIDGVCYQACGDGTYEERVNYMSYASCEDPGGPGTYWTQHFTGGQKAVMGCVIAGFLDFLRGV